MDFITVCVLIGGFCLGRLYGWMKYHYPEFQERIKVMVAKHQVERARYEEELEEIRRRIDDSLHERTMR